jgi:predicted small lipoprotein YifL
MNILSVPMRPALLLVLLAGLMLGCGQRGDLYLRDNPPAGVKPPKPAAHKPIAYPQPVGDPDAGNRP